MPGFTTLAIARRVRQDVELDTLRQQRHSNLTVADDEKATLHLPVDAGEKKCRAKEHRKRRFRIAVQVDGEDEDPHWREEGALARFAWFWWRWR